MIFHSTRNNRKMIQTNLEQFNYADFVRELEKEAFSSSICVQSNANLSEKIKQKLQKKINKIFQKLYNPDKKIKFKLNSIQQKRSLPISSSSPAAKSDFGVRRRLNLEHENGQRNRTTNPTSRISQRKRKFNPNENYEVLCLF